MGGFQEPCGLNELYIIGSCRQANRKSAVVIRPPPGVPVDSHCSY